MFSFSTLLVSRITYVYPAFDSLRIFRHSSGPVKSGSIQSVIIIFGRNFAIDASASFPSFANANSYGCPRKACSSSFRENGESSTTNTPIWPPVLSTAGATIAIACLSSRLISQKLRSTTYGILRKGYLYNRLLRAPPRPRSKAKFPESRPLWNGLQPVPRPLQCIWPPPRYPSAVNSLDRHKG